MPIDFVSHDAFPQRSYCDSQLHIRVRLFVWNHSFISVFWPSTCVIMFESVSLLSCCSAQIAQMKTFSCFMNDKNDFYSIEIYEGMPDIQCMWIPLAVVNPSVWYLNSRYLCIQGLFNLSLHCTLILCKFLFPWMLLKIICFVLGSSEGIKQRQKVFAQQAAFSAGKEGASLEYKSEHKSLAST